MTHTHTLHQPRFLALSMVFAALAIVFTAQLSALQSTAHGLRLQADAQEIRPPALPSQATVHQAALKRSRRKAALKKRLPKSSPRRGVTF